MLYIIQRPDGACFSAADYVDPAYAEALRESVRCGVEVYPVVVHIREDGIHYGGVLEYRDNAAPGTGDGLPCVEISEKEDENPRRPAAAFPASRQVSDRRGMYPEVRYG